MQCSDKKNTFGLEIRDGINTQVGLSTVLYVSPTSLIEEL